MVEEYIVPGDRAGQRIDNFLMGHFKGVPRSRIYKALRKGEVRVNKSRVKPTYRLATGDCIRIPPLKTKAVTMGSVYISHKLRQAILGAIIFEDDDIMVLDKPAGLPVHGGSGVAVGLIEALRVVCNDRPYLELVHRLDKGTSGCLLVAKQRHVLRYLHELLLSCRMDKQYLALVKGHFPMALREINEPLLKNDLQGNERMVRVTASGKKSVTHIKCLAHYDAMSLVLAKPITGRTHQIRVHLAYQGYPIVGDDKYGDDEFNRASGTKRLMLHSASICFPLKDDSRSFGIGVLSREFISQVKSSSL